jgi:DNA-binding transcriptional LysR family regulator
MLQCGALGQFAAHACGPVGPRDHLGAGQCEHELVFRKGGTTASVRVEGRLRIAGNEGAIAAAVAGMGIVTTSSGSCRREMDNGSLVRVLEDWDLGSMELSAVFAGDRTTKRAARAFTDHLIEDLRDA